MPAADVCGFCHKKFDARTGSGAIRVIRGSAVSVTIFRCVNAACTNRFHASCVRDQLHNEVSIVFECPACRTRCTARGPRGLISSAMGMLWCKYPLLMPDWAYATFVINRVADMLAYTLGLVMLVIFYSLAPYVDDPSTGWPSSIQRETAEHIAYTVMPNQLHEFRTRISDTTHPTMAAAMCCAAWLVGWMVISLWLGVTKAAWICIRRRNSAQIAQGVILE